MFTTDIVLQLLAGIASVVIVTACITATCLEFTDAPVISDEDWALCIRPLPHVCKYNGPCNGCPKDGIL